MLTADKRSQGLDTGNIKLTFNSVSIHLFSTSNAHLIGYAYFFQFVTGLFNNQPVLRIH